MKQDKFFLLVFFNVMMEQLRDLHTTQDQVPPWSTNVRRQYRLLLFFYILCVISIIELVSWVCN